MVAPAINSTGNASGRTAKGSGGSYSNWWICLASPSVFGSSNHRMGTLIHLSAAKANTIPALAANTQINEPTKIIVPMLTPRFAATSNGPGVGGTSVCVIVPPATTAKRHAKYRVFVRKNAYRAKGTSR